LPPEQPFSLGSENAIRLEVTDEEIVERMSAHYGLVPDVVRLKDLAALRQKLCDLSEFVRAVKLDFSRWCNRTKPATGRLLGDRFKGVLLESGAAPAQCLAYIERNPVRARTVERPEAYRWNSLSLAQDLI